MERVKC